MENQNKSEFTKDFNEIANINTWFQQDDFNLEEGLVKLKLGVKLIEKCHKRLQEIENEFIEVTKDLKTDESISQSS